MSPTQRWSPISQYASQEPTTYDEELLLSARAGSEMAFAELQDIYARRLYNRIRSITRNHEDAEDALQDAFFRAFRALPSFEGRSRFSSWLTRIAINSALMTIRKRRTRPEVSLEQPVSEGDGTTSMDVQDLAFNPEEFCDQKQRSLAIMHAVDRLDPKLRTPLRMWMAEDSSMKDLAQQLGVSLAAVKARLHRARKRLLRSQAFRKRDTWSAGTPESPHRRRQAPAAPRSSIPKYQLLSESQSPKCESVYAG